MVQLLATFLPLLAGSVTLARVNLLGRTAVALQLVPAAAEEEEAAWATWTEPAAVAAVAVAAEVTIHLVMASNPSELLL